MYIGFTNDLKRRLQEHNEGKSYWTKRCLPFELLYYEAYLTSRDAIARERKLKKFKKSYSELKKRLAHSIALLQKRDGGG